MARVSACVAVVTFVACSAALASSSTASSRRDQAATKMLWYLTVRSPLMKRELAPAKVRRSRPAAGVLNVVRKDGRAWARMLCGPAANSREMRAHGCSWNVTFVRRATYHGFALVKFYKSGGFDVETGLSTCRPIGKSKTCKLFPPPR